MHSLGVADASYAVLIARNLHAVRVRRGLEQRDLVERMRQLGFGNWHRQTLSRIEQGQRNLLAQELLSLAYALDTSIDVLLAPAADERGFIALGDGAVHVQHAAARVRGVNDDAIRWDGNKAVFMTRLGGFGEEAERLGAGSDTEDGEVRAPNEEAG
jgi:transcriptional regulator with XRE-family HTH domain